MRTIMLKKDVLNSCSQAWLYVWFFGSSAETHFFLQSYLSTMWTEKFYLV